MEQGAGAARSEPPRPGRRSPGIDPKIFEEHLDSSQRALAQLMVVANSLGLRLAFEYCVMKVETVLGCA